MNHQDPPVAESTGTLALFPSEAAWARTRVLDAQAIETCDFDLDAFARYRCIRIRPRRPERAYMDILKNVTRSG